MSVQNNLSPESIKLRNRVERAKQDGKLLDVTNLASTGVGGKSIATPRTMKSRFGITFPNALSLAYNIEPLPIVSANFEGYENVINLLNLENSQDYIRAWEDMWILQHDTELGPKYQNYANNLRREFELVDKYINGQELTNDEFDELQRLKNARLLFSVDSNLFNVQQIPREITLEEKRIISDEELRKKETIRKFRLASNARRKINKDEIPTAEEMNALQESERLKAKREQATQSPRNLSPSRTIIQEEKVIDEEERKVVMRKYRLTSSARRKLSNGEVPTAEELNALQESQIKQRERIGGAMMPAITSNVNSGMTLAMISPKISSPKRMIL